MAWLVSLGAAPDCFADGPTHGWIATADGRLWKIDGSPGGTGSPGILRAAEPTYCDLAHAGDHLLYRGHDDAGEELWGIDLRALP